MLFTLRSKIQTTIPVSVQGILPETLHRLSVDRASELLVWQGNRQTRLGELFDIQISDDQTLAPGDDSDCIVWQGNLSSVHWIGAKMSKGRLRVEGDVGRHLGSQMVGGQIDVKGSVGDYAGCEIKGGTIRVHGNAGDWLGAAYPGTKSGMNRGVIVVDGSAGNGVGFAMRRGLIIVGKDIQRLAGWNMLAGTILVGQSVGAMAGKGMIRGTLLLPSISKAENNQKRLPPSFTHGAFVEPGMLAAIDNWITKFNFQSHLRHKKFKLFHGDHLKSGRGEVLIAANSN